MIHKIDGRNTYSHIINVFLIFIRKKSEIGFDIIWKFFSLFSQQQHLVRKSKQKIVSCNLMVIWVEICKSSLIQDDSRRFITWKWLTRIKFLILQWQNIGNICFLSMKTVNNIIFHCFVWFDKLLCLNQSLLQLNFNEGLLIGRI